MIGLPPNSKGPLDGVLDALKGAGHKVLQFVGLEDKPKGTFIPKPGAGRLNSDQSHWISQKLDKYDEYFVGASKETKIPISLLKAIAIKESTGNPNAVSGEDAGLMQIRAGTWEQYAKEFKGDGSIKARLDPKGSIYTAARYLADMKKKYPKWTDAQLIKAYNIGETVMRKDPEVRAYAPRSDYFTKVSGIRNTVDSLEKSRRFPPQ